MTGPSLTRLQIGTLLVMAVVAAGAGLDALGFPARARVYPVTVAVAALVLALLEASRVGRRDVSEPEMAVAAPPLADDLRRAVPFAAWGIGFYLAVWVVGMVTGSVIFVTLFLNRQGRMRWPAALAAGAAVGVALIGLGLWLDLRWPRAVFDLILLTGLY